MAKILISACLLGERVKYDGGDNLQDSSILKDWSERDMLIPICPEMAGGLPTPRPPAEIQGQDGHAVLDGTAKVQTNDGRDVTPEFVSGAQAALEAARLHNVSLAVLKARSPSCGNEYIYNGQFSGIKKPGSGVTAALLERHGVKVFNEDQIQEAALWLETKLKLFP